MCILIHENPIENHDPMPSLNFEFPVFEAEEEDVEEFFDEISRLLKHKEKTIQTQRASGSDQLWF